LLKDIEEASHKLAKLLNDEVDENWLLVPITDNGLKIAEYLSSKLNLPIERLFIETVFCQNNSECEVAFLDEFKNVKFHEAVKRMFGIDKNVVLKAIDVIYEYKLIPKAEGFRGHRKNFSIPQNIENILIVDFSLEQGFRMELAIETLESFGIEEIHIAVPLLPKHIFEIFESKVENLYTLSKIDFYTDVSDYFDELEKDVLEHDRFFLDDFHDS
jgi:predicted phosphoribosyltransferase